MIIQFNTDNHLKATQGFEEAFTERINTSLKHFVDKITRLEIHLSDQNAQKVGPDDVQCNMEARLEGLQPIFVSCKSDTKEKAMNDALDKMKAALTTVMGKLKEK